MQSSCISYKRYVNVVLVLVLDVVVVMRFSKYYRFFISLPIVIKLCMQIEYNILNNRTVSDFFPS